MIPRPTKAHKNLASTMIVWLRVSDVGACDVEGKIFQIIQKIKKNLQAREWDPLACNFYGFFS